MSGKIYLYPNNKNIKKIYITLNGQEYPVTKAYLYPDNKNIFSSSYGYVVTYHIDTNNVVQQEVDDGADCIANAPSATKSGYTFVGWREDTTASSSVLASKTCDSEGINLYAVFYDTLSLYTTANGVQTNNVGNRYYNNGNILNPKIYVANPSKSGATFKGWSTSSSSTTISESTLANGITITATTYRYAVFTYNTATLSVNGSTGADGGTVYLGNVAQGRYSTIVFSIPSLSPGDVPGYNFWAGIGGTYFGNFSVPNSQAWNVGNASGNAYISCNREIWTRQFMATLTGKTVVG